MSPACSGLPSASTEICPARKMVRCELLTSLACTKPHWSCQVQGLMTVLSTTFSLSLARMLVPPFYVSLVSVRQERATARPKVVELALFIQLPRIGILRSSHTRSCISAVPVPLEASKTRSAPSRHHTPCNSGG